MKRHRLWMILVAGSWAALNSGCQTYQQYSPLSSLVKSTDQSSARVEESLQTPIVPPPPPPSNYQPRAVPVARLSASVEPEAEVGQLTVVPTARSASPGDENPATRQIPMNLLPPPSPLPAIPDSPLVAALRSAVQKHPTEAERVLADKYDKTDRELLLGLIRLTASLGETEVGKLSVAEAAVALEQLAAGLRTQLPLALDRMCFCQRIDGFGQFEALSSSHEFQHGSEGRPGERVHVYAELRNFASREVNGQFETTLNSQLEILDEKNEKVTTMNLGSCVDRCLARRQDYFLNVQFHVPARLRPGRYTLRITIRDDTALEGKKGRQVTRALEFRVGQPTSLPVER